MQRRKGSAATAVRSRRPTVLGDAAATDSGSGGRVRRSRASSSAVLEQRHHQHQHPHQHQHQQVATSGHSLGLHHYSAGSAPTFVGIYAPPTSVQLAHEQDQVYSGRAFHVVAPGVHPGTPMVPQTAQVGTMWITGASVQPQPQMAPSIMLTQQDQHQAYSSSGTYGIAHNPSPMYTIASEHGAESRPAGNTDMAAAGVPAQPAATADPAKARPQPASSSTSSHSQQSSAKTMGANAKQCELCGGAKVEARVSSAGKSQWLCKPCALQQTAGKKKIGSATMEVHSEYSLLPVVVKKERKTEKQQQVGEVSF